MKGPPGERGDEADWGRLIQKELDSYVPERLPARFTPRTREGRWRQGWRPLAVGLAALLASALSVTVAGDPAHEFMVARERLAGLATPASPVATPTSSPRVALASPSRPRVRPALAPSPAPPPSPLPPGPRPASPLPAVRGTAQPASPTPTQTAAPQSARAKTPAAESSPASPALGGQPASQSQGCLIDLLGACI